MKKEEIINRIEKRVNISVGSKYGEWHIGATNDINKSINQYGHNRYFESYKLDYSEDIEEIINYFKKKDMKIISDICIVSKHIFIF